MEFNNLDEKLEALRNKENKFYEDLNEIVSGNLREHIDATRDLLRTRRIKPKDLSVKIAENTIFDMEDLAIIYSLDGNFSYENDIVYTLCGNDENLIKELYISRHDIEDNIHSLTEGIEKTSLYSFLERNDVNTSDIITKLEERISTIYDSLQ